MNSLLNKPLCVCFVMCLLTVSAAAPSLAAPSSLQDKVDAAFKAGRAAYALALLQQEVDRGNPEAQYGLGVLYEKGLPAAKISRDASLAFHWYSLSAQTGYASSQNNLGFLYYTGRGTPKSEAEALRWYEKASQQGNAMAQYNLGAMYFHGHGVTKDLKKALELYKQSALQGNVTAENNVNSSFPSGHTTSAFGAATTLSEYYPTWEVMVPAYVAAGAVGFSRLYANQQKPNEE